MEPFWFFRLRFRRAYDSAYDSDFWFSLGRKCSYDSDSDSDSDSVASENQPSGLTVLTIMLLCGFNHCISVFQLVRFSNDCHKTKTKMQIAHRTHENSKQKQGSGVKHEKTHMWTKPKLVSCMHRPSRGGDSRIKVIELVTNGGNLHEDPMILLPGLDIGIINKKSNAKLDLPSANLLRNKSQTTLTILAACGKQ